MFLKFSNETERDNYGGTAFIELQYCKLKRHSGIDEIFRTKNLPIWNYEDALFVYVDDELSFSDSYRELLGNGMYENRKTGLYDIYGINYFSPECIGQIIKRVNENMPIEYEVFLEWLEGAKEYNGFYLLGL